MPLAPSNTGGDEGPPAEDKGGDGDIGAYGELQGDRIQHLVEEERWCLIAEYLHSQRRP